MGAVSFTSPNPFSRNSFASDLIDVVFPRKVHATKISHSAPSSRSLIRLPKAHPEHKAQVRQAGHQLSLDGVYTKARNSESRIMMLDVKAQSFCVGVLSQVRCFPQIREAFGSRWAPKEPIVLSGSPFRGSRKTALVFSDSITGSYAVGFAHRGVSSTAAYNG